VRTSTLSRRGRRLQIPSEPLAGELRHSSSVRVHRPVGNVSATSPASHKAFLSSGSTARVSSKCSTKSNCSGNREHRTHIRRFTELSLAGRPTASAGRDRSFVQRREPTARRLRGFAVDSLGADLRGDRYGDVEHPFLEAGLRLGRINGLRKRQRAEELARREFAAMDLAFVLRRRPSRLDRETNRTRGWRCVDAAARVDRRSTLSAL
jgi:hypothetical protein